MCLWEPQNKHTQHLCPGDTALEHFLTHHVEILIQFL